MHLPKWDCAGSKTCPVIPFLLASSAAWGWRVCISRHRRCGFSMSHLPRSTNMALRSLRGISQHIASRADWSY